jgi:hypothetical protein
MVTLAAFVGVFFTETQFSFEVALKGAIRRLLSVFGSFYLSSYLLKMLLEKFYDKERSLHRCQQFIGYASSLLYVVTALCSLLPSDFFFMHIFVLYAVIIIYEGVIPYMGIEESRRNILTAVTFFMIIIIPFMLDRLLFLLMPGLRV